MTIDKSVLGVAGEFAVASELCRRNVYAQLTLGNQKRTDLLVMSGGGKFTRIEVKAKQKQKWPMVRGIGLGDSFLVLVDFKKQENERPDFYVLSAKEWLELAGNHVAVYLKKHPRRTAHLDELNCPVYPEEVDKHGKPSRGMTIAIDMVLPHKDAWRKIVESCAAVTDEAIVT